MARATGLARKLNRPGWGGARVYLSQIPSPLQGVFFYYALPVVDTTGSFPSALRAKRQKGGYTIFENAIGAYGEGNALHTATVNSCSGSLRYLSYQGE